MSTPVGGPSIPGLGDLLGQRDLANKIGGGSGEGGDQSTQGTGEPGSPTNPEDQGNDQVSAEVKGALAGQAFGHSKTGEAALSNIASSNAEAAQEGANALSGMSQNIAQGADGSPPSGNAAATGNAIPGSTTQ